MLPVLFTEWCFDFLSLSFFCSIFTQAEMILTGIPAADTLHRFCKKEHDWGWKKFMELNKVLEGFTVSNTLVIKAQVQVIRCVTCYDWHITASTSILQVTRVSLRAKHRASSI